MKKYFINMYWRMQATRYPMGFFQLNGNLERNFRHFISIQILFFYVLKEPSVKSNVFSVCIFFYVFKSLKQCVILWESLNKLVMKMCNNLSLDFDEFCGLFSLINWEEEFQPLKPFTSIYYIKKKFLTNT